MSDGWSSVRLSDVLGFQEGPGILAKDFRPEGVPLLRLKGLDRREASLEGCNFVDPRKVEKTWSHFRLRRGDILTSTSASFGRVAVVGSEAEGAIFYTGIIRFWPKDRRIDRKFVEYVLKSPDFAEQGRRAASGSVIQHFGPTHLREMSLLLPPVPEQQAITGILGALDDKIELNRRINATLEAMARALFRSWFVDFDPVRAKAAGEAPAHMDAATAALFPDRFGEDGLPEGWGIGTLADLADLNPEKWGKRNEPDSVEYVDLANTKWGVIESTSRFAWSEAPSRARMVLRPNDTVVGTVRPGNGSYAFISDNGLTGSTGFAVLRPRDSWDATLVYLASTDPAIIEALANLADGGAYPAVRPDVVAACEVIAAPVLLREAFAKTADSLLSRIETAKRENRTLASLRDALLPKLMSGELRVREAEAQVAEAV